MSWIKNLGSMAKSTVDFTGVPGLLKDLATSGSNDDPWYIDGVNFVKNTVKVATTPVRAAVSGLLAVGEASYELGGKVRREGVETILEQPFMYNKFKAPGESYADYTLRVEREKENISLGQAALSALSPGRNAGDNSGWYQEWSENNLKFLSAGFDVFNEEDVLWAIATRFQADTDMFMVPKVFCNRLDPSAVDGMSAKLGLDATAPLTWDVERTTLPAEVVAAARAVIEAW